MSFRFSLSASLCLSVLFAATPFSPQEQSLLNEVTAASLKGHVSFLASDLLEGRDTPSRGLDLAAEYVAAQFRRAGLEPAGDDGYFQSAKFATVRQPMEGFELTLTIKGKEITVAAGKAGIQAREAAAISNAAIVKPDPEAYASWTAEQIQGKAVIWTLPSMASLPDDERAAVMKKVRGAREMLVNLKPAIVITTGMRGAEGSWLRDLSDQAPSLAAAVNIRDQDGVTLLKDLPLGPVEGFVNAKLPAAIETPVTLKNVAGLLRGSDPELSKTYVLVTAHYDHIGIRGEGDGDRINNGANDDASGTASVLELASAFGRATERPKRSMLFMTYFGEEKGLLGSRFYGRNPIFPLKQTVGNLNLEHMGRTDDSEGSTAGKLTASGFDYTSLGESLTQAGKLTGIETWHHERNSDAFFARSDNQSLADVGIPAITLAVAWIFPDYHRPGDHWDKLDYQNLEKVNRTVALALWRITNDPAPPRWIDSNPKTEKYVHAYRELHPGN